MELPWNCSECEYWMKTYETATLAFIRLQSQLHIASLCGDLESSRKLTQDVDWAAIRRHELRAAAQQHRDLVHGIALSDHLSLQLAQPK
jgi:hypothetical protein